MFVLAADSGQYCGLAAVFVHGLNVLWAGSGHMFAVFVHGLTCASWNVLLGPGREELRRAVGRCHQPHAATSMQFGQCVRDERVVLYLWHAVVCVGTLPTVC